MKAAVRDMVRENHLRVDELIYPVFVTAATDVVTPVESMPGISQHPLNALLHEIDRAWSAGVRSVLLFGIPAKKDPEGSGASDPQGVVPLAIRLIKAQFPEMVVIADVCLCEYTSHGHCGLIDADGRVLNDRTLPHLARAAVVYAEAGADIIAPSDMMDRRDPPRARRGGLREDAAHRLLDEVRLADVRSVPRRRPFGAAVRRSQDVSDGSGERTRGAS